MEEAVEIVQFHPLPLEKSWDYGHLVVDQAKTTIDMCQPFKV